jgi:hypothetical protein
MHANPLKNAFAIAIGPIRKSIAFVITLLPTD